jgi:hypothetical protein
MWSYSPKASSVDWIDTGTQPAACKIYNGSVPNASNYSSGSGAFGLYTTLGNYTVLSAGFKMPPREFTISFICSAFGNTGYVSFFDGRFDYYNKGIDLYFQDPNSEYFYDFNSSYLAAGYYNMNTSIAKYNQLYTLTYDGSVLKFYINNVLPTGNQPVTGYLVTYTQQLTNMPAVIFNGRYQSGSVQYAGTISARPGIITYINTAATWYRIMVYDYAITSTQVSANYNRFKAQYNLQ